MPTSAGPAVPTSVRRAEAVRRVVHVVESTVYGGAERAVLTLMTATDRSQWEPVLFHHDAPALAPLVDGARAAGLTTVAVPVMPPGFTGVRRIPGLARRFRRIRPDVAHLHLTWPLGCQYQLIAARLARVPKVVATVHLSLHLTLGRRVMVQQRLLTKLMEGIIAVSGHTRDALVTDLGWPAEKITVVPNAVPLDHPGPQLPTLGEELAPGALVVALVPGRMVPQKGHRYLLEAARQVSGVRFLLAGDGPDRPLLEGLATELQISDRVRFLGQRNDVPELMAVSDLVVVPSLFEGWPLVVLEAMAAGRAIVSTRIGGIVEMIRDGENGVLVEPADPAALAAAIRDLAADPGRRDRLGAAARATALSSFSVEMMWRAVETVYTDEAPVGSPATSNHGAR